METVQASTGSDRLTLREAHEWLRVSPVTLYRLMARGEIAVVRIGRRTFVERSELERFIASRRTRRRPI